jgi:hypothetical protein
MLSCLAMADLLSPLWGVRHRRDRIPGLRARTENMAVAPMVKAPVDGREHPSIQLWGCGAGCSRARGKG